MKETRIIVAGSRGFEDYELLKITMKDIFAGRNIKRTDVTIVSGTANGADKLGERYAGEYGLKVERFPADWKSYGKRAGYIRNEKMAKYSIENGSTGVLLAFWDGDSRGTKLMIGLAEQYGLEVHVKRY